MNDKSIFNKEYNEIEQRLEEANTLTDDLKFWNEANTSLKFWNEFVERIKNKIRAKMKENSWDRYLDKDTNISVTISKHEKKSVDLEQLKLMMNEEDMAKVCRITTFEKLSIITPNMRERLKKNVRTK